MKLHCTPVENMLPGSAVLFLSCFLLLASCSTVQQQQATTMGGIQGATTGAVIGAASNKPVQGAVIGAVIGATTGAILSSPQPASQPIASQ
ncbi:MAG: bacteriocin [Zetaproteobacteria bacterium CG12_big_fil_rev_8_21_14_0_65_55_1124]|nr:MAG: hypothetical protein AUJ58_10145 [Zetaproteobacteria bacterium CG1_02_55_237]PIS19935.1 MAG: bacteriocin [Zetaproteobacteria bacterium CG08_land_8_20_14_0_20_55_17]PIW43642.1 MAG: bacteriocin [Zetaproteobacteria bacterium CG12_big_fil_rev_8_21_14_0_65_55_1124]PIY52689.1 MAG: bacteriocin [Zetaproteobacteria bacterium CG_4_10_14_0_8_um_filter_55_43]PIZ37873.1 MAG: bacteriocin [Zetaproteobacteria bacterium CG_4_10_14_0_2_um_filter_55_20]PJB80477.1 MAG: bacteriocin [Zetaproteobacteria bact